MHNHIWRHANLRLIPSGLLALAGATVNVLYRRNNGNEVIYKLIEIIGTVTFVIFAAIFLHVLTNALFRIISSHRLGAGRAASVKFSLRVLGYLFILLSALALLNIPIGRLLLGGAAIGIILGVAAQQALANFFASIVLIIAHPFSVGENITFNSGALGGIYQGTVIDIGLTHSKIIDENGDIVFLPNATLLSGATIRKRKT